MAGQLGDLVVALHADIAQFNSDMGRAARISEREWNKVAGHAAAAGKMIAAAGVVAAAAALKMGADFIEAAANLDDMAEKTGASVENLSKLEQQARISGASLETVEMGLVRLSKSLHANDEESKKATRALDALGLKADDLKNKDTATALQIVANEMNKYADSSGKTALALDLFGKSGAALLPILKDMANDGELNARVTAQQAAEAEELGKSWRRITNDAQALGQALALELVPGIQRTVTEFREAMRVSEGFLSGMALFFSTGNTSDPVGKLNEITKKLEVVKRQRADFEKMGGIKKFFSADDIAILDAQINLFEKQRAVLTQVAIARGDRDNFDPSFNRRPISYESAAKAVGGGKKDTELERAAHAAGEQTRRMHAADLKAYEHYRNEIARISAEMKDRRYYENIYGEDRLAGMSIENIRALHKATIDGAQTMMESGDAAKRAYEGFDENGKSLIETTKKADDLAKSLGLTFSSAFEDAVVNGKKLRDVLQGIAQDIARIMLRKNVTEPLANELGGFLSGGSGFLRNLFSGGSGSGAGFSLGDPALLANAAGLVGSFAEGTDYVPHTGLALVHQGEKIIPAGERENRGAMAPIVINAPGADRQQLAVVTAQVAAMRSDMKYGYSMTDSARRRGGKTK